MDSLHHRINQLKRIKENLREKSIQSNTSKFDDFDIENKLIYSTKYGDNCWSNVFYLFFFLFFSQSQSQSNDEGESFV